MPKPENTLKALCVVSEDELGQQARAVQSARATCSRAAAAANEVQAALQSTQAQIHRAQQARSINAVWLGLLGQQYRQVKRQLEQAHVTLQAAQAAEETEINQLTQSRLRHQELVRAWDAERSLTKTTLATQAQWQADELFLMRGHNHNSQIEVLR
jgi:hypothetical protein